MSGCSIRAYSDDTSLQRAIMVIAAIRRNLWANSVISVCARIGVIEPAYHLQLRARVLMAPHSTTT